MPSTGPGPDSTRLLPVLQAAGGEGAYLYCLDPLQPESGAVAYARFFNPTAGIAEDPATGTPPGPLVAALAARGIVPDGGSAVIEQGHRMGRPAGSGSTSPARACASPAGGWSSPSGTLHLDILLRVKAEDSGSSWKEDKLRFAVHRPGDPVASRAFTACPAAMLIAAFTSALAVCPQAVHRNSAWLSRLLLST